MNVPDIPDEVWERWKMPRYLSLRRAVLIYGGSIRKEVPIHSFPDVVTSCTIDDNQQVLKGVFYITTRRFVFIPKDKIPSLGVIQCGFDELRCISGNRSNISISVIDSEGSSANFQFPTAQSLFYCFNLLRKLSESMRMDDVRFKAAITQIIEAKTLDETPFTTLEIELSECTHLFDVEDEFPLTEIIDETYATPIHLALDPIMGFLNYFNDISFDIHIKLRYLLVTGFVTFCLKYMSFLPFISLCVSFYLIATAWANINKENLAPKGNEDDIPFSVGGFIRIQRFLADWFCWSDPHKSLLMLKVHLVSLISYMILPDKYYYPLWVCLFLLFIYKLTKEKVFNHLFSGYWFCT